MKKSMVALGIASALLVLFFVPVVPIGLFNTWAPNCLPATAFCGSGEGLLKSGYGSVTYGMLGVGGVLNLETNHYTVLRNGCYVSADGSATSCYSSCVLNASGLCASPSTTTTTIYPPCLGTIF